MDLEKNWELNWQNPKLFLQHVKTYKGRNNGRDKGFGVFTSKNIKKGECLVIFGGYIIPRDRVFDLPKALQEYCYQIHDNFFFGPVKKNEVSLSEHYNHSCEPNAGFKDSITLVAIKDIKKDEEITMDYAMCITGNEFNFKCDCGLKECRKYIKGSDWKIKKLQEKYGNYFQPYILEKINKLNKK